MLSSPDPFDPNFLDFGHDHEYRIYGDDRLNTWAVVDREDYQWALQYRWNMKTCNRNKSYLRRAVAVWENKRLVKTISLYLHIEIMKRTGKLPPTPLHRKVDHRDGEESNCRRSNLRWATDSMNARNIRGSHSHELMEGL